MMQFEGLMSPEGGVRFIRSFYVGKKVVYEMSSRLNVPAPKWSCCLLELIASRLNQI
jgi:hypothetical protein